jgi:hypothetical protein
VAGQLAAVQGGEEAAVHPQRLHHLPQPDGVGVGGRVERQHHGEPLAVGGGAQAAQHLLGAEPVHRGIEDQERPVAAGAELLQGVVARPGDLDGDALQLPGEPGCEPVGEAGEEDAGHGIGPLVQTLRKSFRR